MLGCESGTGAPYALLVLVISLTLGNGGKLSALLHCLAVKLRLRQRRRLVDAA